MVRAITAAIAQNQIASVATDSTFSMLTTPDSPRPRVLFSFSSCFIPQFRLKYAR